MPKSDPGGAWFVLCKAGHHMTKRQLIDEILTINRSAKAAFLAKFDGADLDEYLQHLLVVREPRLRTGLAEPDAEVAPAEDHGETEGENEQQDAEQPAAGTRGELAFAGAVSDRKRDRTIRSSIADEKSQRWLL